MPEATGPEPERNEWMYVTAGSQVGQKLTINAPFGLIAPPMVEMYKPLEGTIVFYHAQGYGLPVPPG